MGGGSGDGQDEAVGLQEVEGDGATVGVGGAIQIRDGETVDDEGIVGDSVQLGQSAFAEGDGVAVMVGKVDGQRRGAELERATALHAE